MKYITLFESFKHLLEGEDDPLNPAKPIRKVKIPTVNLQIPKLDFYQQSILKSNLWNEINKNAELKHSLINNSHNEDNFLNKIWDFTHVHYDPDSQHLGFEISHLGKKHNIIFDLGLGLERHDSTNDHGHSQSSILPSIPHPLVDTSFKFPLDNIFNRKIKYGKFKLF